MLFRSMPSSEKSFGVMIQCPQLGRPRPQRGEKCECVFSRRNSSPQKTRGTQKPDRAFDAAPEKNCDPRNEFAGASESVRGARPSPSATNRALVVRAKPAENFRNASWFERAPVRCEGALNRSRGRLRSPKNAEPLRCAEKSCAIPHSSRKNRSPPNKP